MFYIGIRYMLIIRKTSHSKYTSACIWRIIVDVIRRWWFWGGEWWVCAWDRCCWGWSRSSWCLCWRVWMFCLEFATAPTFATDTFPQFSSFSSAYLWKANPRSRFRFASGSAGTWQDTAHPSVWGIIAIFNQIGRVWTLDCWLVTLGSFEASSGHIDALYLPLVEHGGFEDGWFLELDAAETRIYILKVKPFHRSRMFFLTSSLSTSGSFLLRSDSRLGC